MTHDLRQGRGQDTRGGGGQHGGQRRQGGGQVSCDWLPAAHVTSVAASDWLVQGDHGGAGDVRVELRLPRGLGAHGGGGEVSCDWLRCRRAHL